MEEAFSVALSYFNKGECKKAYSCLIDSKNKLVFKRGNAVG